MKPLYLLFLAIAALCLHASAAIPQRGAMVHIGKDKGLMSGNVNAMAQDARGFLWIATDLGVNRYDGYNFNAYKIRRRDNTDYCIESVVYDSKTDAVIATDVFGYVFSIDCSSQETDSMGCRGKVVPPPLDEKLMGTAIISALENEGVDKESVTCVLKDNYGNIWVGTRGYGLYVMPMHKAMFNVFYAKDVVHAANSSMVSDKKGNIWTLTDDCQLHKTDKRGKTEAVSIGKEKYTNIVNCMAIDKKGVLWLGTYRGLAFIDTNRSGQMPQYINCNKRLAGMCVMAICTGSEGDVWMSHPHGISKYESDSMRVVNFDWRDGLPQCEYVKGSAWFDGQMVNFGFYGGYVSFLPDNCKKISDFKLSLDVSEVKALSYKDEKLICMEKADKITLDYDYNTIKMAFFVNDLTCKDNLKYTYILEGVDKEWRGNSRNNRAEYYNLPYGTYRLTVKVRLRNSDFEKGAQKTITIVIKPPLWLSWQAKVVYVVLFLLTSVIMARLVLRIAARKEQKRQAMLQQQREEEFMQRKLELYTNITHELRTPLTLILGPLEDLTDEPGLGEKVSRKIGVVYKSANNLLDIVNRLLDFKEAEMLSVAADGEKCDVAALANECGVMFAELNTNPGVQIKAEIEDGIVPVEANAEALRTVMRNLMGNALKYTVRGHIVLRLYTDAGRLCLAVADTGCGIPEWALERVFDKGFQVGGEHQRKGNGIGLGMVRKICRQLGGDIAVESREGQGTVFTATLPYRRWQERVEHRDEQAESMDTTVLVVEDNADIRAFVVQTLEAEYLVVEASDGREALAVAQNVMPDIVVSDVMMPVMDGLQMCRELKDNLQTSHIPVILLTAKDTISDKEAGYEIGADSYITKPFSGRLLLARVKNLLRSKQMQAERVGRAVTDAGNGALYVARQCGDKDTACGMQEDTDAQLTLVDREFLERLKTVIAGNIADERLDIDFLTAEMNMSRSTLYRKVKSLTGMSANALIRKARLERALTIIAVEGRGVAEAAYSSGFNDLANFRSAFKQEYGVMPKEYKRQ